MPRLFDDTLTGVQRYLTLMRQRQESAIYGPNRTDGIVYVEGNRNPATPSVGAVRFQNRTALTGGRIVDFYADPASLTAVAWVDMFGTFVTINQMYAQQFVHVNSSPSRRIRWGTGTPEGVVTESPGSLYLNLSGGAGTTLYIKESGTGNTGWVGK